MSVYGEHWSSIIIPKEKKSNQLQLFRISNDHHNNHDLDHHHHLVPNFKISTTIAKNDLHTHTHTLK